MQKYCSQVDKTQPYYDIKEAIAECQIYGETYIALQYILSCKEEKCTQSQNRQQYCEELFSEKM